MIRKILLVSSIGSLLTTAVAAAEVDMTMFGHHVSITKAAEQGNPRLDGPLDTCFGVRVDRSAESLTLSTAPTPNKAGEKWIWTASDGLKAVQGDKFVADSSKGWAQLRERTASHPSELLDYVEIGNEIASMAGPDRELVNDILMGVGSGEFKGDYFVGLTCSRHMCLDQEGLVIADMQNKKIYLAWKPSGQKIKVSPPVKE
ncbi:hypothetical protein ABIE78_001643 [Sinorhizobium fredii]|uniref:Uncharacterized protein y4bG n=1 Tax=Sinorhizobium fredii (strain USDA 257) TaxID=1185652 RepID=I3X9B9_SINF2|nr:hypothetical protein [Sinorhizobium fredii]AFL52475.1 uncharacterized protein y4bG [Sinorhizobium fredii USDA 257]